MLCFLIRMVPFLLLRPFFRVFCFQIPAKRDWAIGPLHANAVLRNSLSWNGQVSCRAIWRICKKIWRPWRAPWRGSWNAGLCLGDSKILVVMHHLPWARDKKVHTSYLLMFLVSYSGVPRLKWKPRPEKPGNPLALAGIPSSKRFDTVEQRESGLWHLAVAWAKRVKRGLVGQLVISRRVYVVSNVPITSKLR